LIVALSGFACNGKSTIANHLHRKYNHIEIVKELVRDVYDFDLPIFINQMELLSKALYFHTTNLRIYKTYKYKKFIVDRSILDYIIFTEMLLDVGLKGLAKHIPFKEMYDRIILLNPIYDKIDDCLEVRFNVGSTKQEFISMNNMFMERFLWYVEQLGLDDLVEIVSETDPNKVMKYIEDIVVRGI